MLVSRNSSGARRISRTYVPGTSEEVLLFAGHSTSVCRTNSLRVQENIVAWETPQDASHHSPGVADSNRVANFHKLARNEHLSKQEAEGCDEKSV